MEELKGQLAAIENQLAEEKAKGDVRDMTIIAVLEQNQADTLAKMDEAAKTQEVQTAVATAKTDIQDSLAEFMYNGETLSIYQFTENIEGANILIEYIQERIGTITAGAISYKQALEAVTLKLEDAEESMLKLRKENDRLDRNGADLQAKRDAAGEEILNLQAENTRINQELKDLRENIIAPKPAHTNLNGNAGQSITDWKTARPKIYNVRWKDNYLRNIQLANYASNGEELEFSYLAIGKYNVITEAEALQFRTNTEQTSGQTPEASEPVQEVAVPDRPLDTIAVPELSFPSQEEVPDAHHADSGNTAVSEMVAEMVSRAEFEELKQRVNAMEAGRLGELA